TDKLLLQAPRSLTSGGRLDKVQITWEDKKLAVPSVAATKDEDLDLLTIVLPNPTLGSGKLTLEYVVPMERPETDRNTPVSIPLFAPAQAELTQHVLNSTSPPGLKVDVNL